MREKEKEQPTPGPYKFDSCRMIYMECTAPDEWHWAGWVRTRTIENARLICAAPDLLAACEAMVLECTRHQSICDANVIMDATRAIAKAKGSAR